MSTKYHKLPCCAEWPLSFPTLATMTESFTIPQPPLTNTVIMMCQEQKLGYPALVNTCFVADLE